VNPGEDLEIVQLSRPGEADGPGTSSCSRRAKLGPGLRLASPSSRGSKLRPTPGCNLWDVTYSVIFREQASKALQQLDKPAVVPGTRSTDVCVLVY